MSFLRRSLIGLALCLLALPLAVTGDAGGAPPADPKKDDYATLVQPLIKQYCLSCHSAKVKKGDLDLERFTSLDHVRKDVKPWQAMIEMLESHEMPPKSKPQPTAEEHKRLLGWVRNFVDAEARARAGDPGPAPLRRLSNAEYDATIRDLTGVDLRPAREFPADGAAGEGFTNAAEALSLSPALLDKYLAAAKDVADRAVLLPDGFRFSPAKTRRDWTDECLARLREFYAAYTAADGRLPLAPYLAATVRHRDALLSGKVTTGAVAEQEKLNPKYLGILWRTLTDERPSFPLDGLRARWRKASDKDVPALVAEVVAWQRVLWKFVPIGSYRDGKTIRQEANDPAATEVQTLKVNLKPAPGQGEVVLYLAADELPAAKEGGYVVWRRPRFEGTGKPPLLLRDYAQFGPQYEVDYPAVFGDTAKYLAAAVEAAGDRKLSADDVAKKHGLDAALTRRWIDVLALSGQAPGAEDPGKVVTAVALELLGEQSKNGQKPAINGWKKKGTDLPVLVTNSSDTVEHVPGKVSPHRVTVHPTPTEFVAAAWKSPLDGRVRVTAKVAHAHPACGNGVGWWLEHRHGDKASALAEGAVNVGGQAQVAPRTLKVAKGDVLFLAVDARDGDHSCDLTEITLTVAETDKPGRTWDLAGDVADSVLDGNPHADKHGNKEVWSFVKGPARPAGTFAASATGPTIPADSALGRWRAAAADPAKREEATKLAGRVAALLAGARPAQEKHPDRVLYDNLVSLDGPLFRGLDLSRLAKARPAAGRYGLDKAAFGRHPLGKPADADSLVVPATGVTEVRLPAALFRDREFVVDGRLDPAGGDRAVQFRVLTAPPPAGAPWDGKAPVVAAAGSAARKQLLDGFAAFRTCFPQYVCYPHIVPTDEVVCLKLYHREDEPLMRLFLDDAQTRRLERLWAEQRFISQWPVTEHKNLPLFIGFVTQDQPKALVTYFEGLREPFRKRAEEFEKEVAAAAPKQLDALAEFAALAYRRPLRDGEKAELLGLYDALRKKGASQEEAFRGVLARVFVSPSFLFHMERPPAGKEPRPVNDWELASRLSYFLWSSVPDEELRRSAAGTQPANPAHAEGPGRAGAGGRVRHAMDSRPRLRRAEGEEREAIPDLRRPLAQGDL
jgi:hypothetical protein